MRKSLTWGLTVITVALGASAFAATRDRPKSGLPVGESTDPFNVLDVTGPNKGRSLCYR